MTSPKEKNERAWIVDNGHFIREVVILKKTKEFCIIKYVYSGAVIRTRTSRLFPTKREAKLSRLK